jgi:hypothetical protein
MSKYVPEIQMKFAAVQVWSDGGQTVVEFFYTQAECVAWIKKQKKESGFVWHVGEFE